MERGQLMFKIDAMTQKLADAAQTISACVAQLGDQRDETMTQMDGRVRYAELVQAAMGAYLTGFGQFRGKSADEVVEFFKAQVSPSLSAMPHLIEEQYHLRSIRDIAAEIGCSPMGLHSHMRRQGIAIREKPPSKRKKRAEASE
jgi:hypothetical protein